jgi:hypothetical protein
MITLYITIQLLFTEDFPINPINPIPNIKHPLNGPNYVEILY